VGQGSQLKSKRLHCSQKSHSVAWCLGFNINGPCVVANVGVTDIMLCNMALASTPLAVGRVARSLIEKGLLLERFVWGL